MTKHIDEYEENMEDLDSSWIQEFENVDKMYKHYYTEELTFIRVQYLYINKENEIENIKEEKVLLKKPGFMTKEEMLSIIKHNSFLNHKKYSLLSIVKYIIDINPMNLHSFLKSKNMNVGSRFIQPIKNIDTIRFEKSISMFHDINNINILFYNKFGIGNYNIKNIGCHNNFTKKIFIQSNANKNTRRKQYKDTDLLYNNT
jgi:hypothetical protein